MNFLSFLTKTNLSSFAKGHSKLKYSDYHDYNITGASGHLQTETVLVTLHLCYHLTGYNTLFHTGLKIEYMQTREVIKIKDQNKYFKIQSNQVSTRLL